jgi:high-affinity iron transporter
MGLAMHRSERAILPMGVIFLLALVYVPDAAARAGVDVSGVIRMPDACSPAVSPAVVYLEPLQAVSGSSSANASIGPADVAVVNQRGLQFLPRIQAVSVGKAIRFANQDSETHNVHVLTPGFGFNQSMAAGDARDFTPSRPGVMTLACDVHSHMRGFVVVSPSPWFQVCTRTGKYRLTDVPPGRYQLTAWHEMGDPVHQEIDVREGKPLDVSPITLTASAGAFLQAVDVRSKPTLAWPQVLDRISVTLEESRDAASRSKEAARAIRLADDAYFSVFEASEMEIAVRKFLGYTRSGRLEREFRGFRSAVVDVTAKRKPASSLSEPAHTLLLDLITAANELNTKGITDPSKIDLPRNTAAAEAGPETVAGDTTESPDSVHDPVVLLQALERGFHRIGAAALNQGPDAAASELSNVYMTEFEPVERYLLGRSPQSIRPLEIRFNALRGDLTAGLNGDELDTRLRDLSNDVRLLIDQLEARPSGSFSTAFVASLITLVREGVEVILILAMLFALVSKALAAASPDCADQDCVNHATATAQLSAARGRAFRSIWLGVGVACVLSLATALALNALVASARGSAREVIEGVVMLLASGVLFYVSYWLISQVESKRWMDYLKIQARRGLEMSGRGTLAVTAFLAVYREGAETALMFQALLGSQGRTQPGLLGIAAGSIAALLVLAVVAYVIRATSSKLPLRTFFSLTGMMLFVMAVIFAGNGVFELQNAGILVTTPLTWLGTGLPLVGLYPNVQVVSIQGLLVFGAVAAWFLMPGSSSTPRQPKPGRRAATPDPELANSTANASANTSVAVSS